MSRIGEIAQTIGKAVRPKINGVTLSRYGSWELPLPSGGTVIITIGDPMNTTGEKVGMFNDAISAIRHDKNYARRRGYNYGPIQMKTTIAQSDFTKPSNAGAVIHPVVSWDLGVGAWQRANTEGRKAAVTVGREAIQEVSKFLKKHAEVYSPSAYEFYPTSDSRNKLYRGMSQRVPSKYKYAELENKHGAETKMMVQAPSLTSDILGGLAATVPLGLLTAASLTDTSEFLRPNEKTANRKPQDFLLSARTVSE